MTEWLLLYATTQRMLLAIHAGLLAAILCEVCL